MNNTMCNRVAAILLVVLSLSACESDIEKGLKELKQLCEKDAGLTIYKTVEADGYLDATGNGIDLVKSPYRFYEYCDDNPTFVEIEPEPGCYRVEKIKRDLELCHIWFEERLSTFVVDPYPGFMKDNCIAVKKIDKPMARYSYHSSPKSWLAKNNLSEFRRSESYIQDRVVEKVIGRYVSYSFNVRPGFSSPKSCHRVDARYISYVEANLVAGTIFPQGGGKL